VDNQLSVAHVIDQLPATPIPRARVVRRVRWWALLAVAVVSFVTGVAGFVDAFQKADTQIIAAGLLLLVILGFTVRVLVKRRKPLPITLDLRVQLSLEPTTYQQLLAQAQVSHRQIWVGRVVRLLDYSAWVVLAIVLMLSAATVFLFSAFGLYDGVRTGIDIFDVVLVMGLVGPYNSVRSGLAKWRARRNGARQRVNTLSETVRNALGALNNFWNSASESTAGVVRTGLTTVSSSVASTATSVAIGITITGVGLAAVSVTPNAVIATGRVVPLPPVVASIAGPAGRDVGVRGAIIYGCMDDIVAGSEGNADQSCQAAVHQVGSVCDKWDGHNMPTACEQQIFTLLPEIQALVGSNNDKPRGPPPDQNSTRNPERQLSVTDIPQATRVPATASPTMRVIATATMTTVPATSTVTAIPITNTSMATQKPPEQPTQGVTANNTPPANDAGGVPPNMTQRPSGPNNDANGNPLDTPIAGTGPQTTPVP